MATAATVVESSKRTPVADAGRDPDAALRAKLQKAVRRACPPWAASQVEDIVQAAMIRVIRVREKREGNEPLPASYLWKVAYTATIDELRRLRAKREVALDTDDGSEPVAAPQGDPSRRAEAEEITRGLQDCLARLVETRRQAVSLYLAGHTVPEAARLLHWPPKRAENMVYRGLADLRGCLEKKGLRP